jgi:hypothetical protein
LLDDLLALQGCRQLWALQKRRRCTCSLDDLLALQCCEQLWALQKSASILHQILILAQLQILHSLLQWHL